MATTTFDLCLLILDMEVQHQRYKAARQDKRHGQLRAIPIRLKIREIHDQLIDNGIMSPTEVMIEFSKHVPYAQV